MAKKKSGKAKGAKLPKRIAGVKVPKELREPGGRLLEAMNNRLLVDAAAAALAAAASRFAEPRRAAPEAARPPSADLATLLSSLAVEGIRRFGEAGRVDARTSEPSRPTHAAKPDKPEAAKPAGSKAATPSAGPRGE